MVFGFRFVFFILLFISVQSFGSEFILSGSCGGEVTKGGLILPGDAAGLVSTNELSFREALIGAAKRQMEAEYHSYGRVVRWVAAYTETRDTAIDLPEHTETDAIAAGQRAMEKAIENSLQTLRGDERAVKVLKYFGTQYPGVSGIRLQKLARALLLQCYLARFEQLTIEQLALRVPIEIPLLTANGDIIDLINIEVTDQMKDPRKLEDRFLIILPKIPLRTYGVISDEKGKAESAYLRADTLMLEAAKAKAEALSLDPGVPDVARDFAKWYLLGVSIRPQGQVHPLLVDWASNVEAFMTAEPQK